MASQQAHSRATFQRPAKKAAETARSTLLLLLSGSSAETGPWQNQGLSFSSRCSGEGEPGAALGVRRKTDQRHEPPRLSRHVGADAAAVRLRIDGAPGQRGDVRDPGRLLCIAPRFGRRALARAQGARQSAIHATCCSVDAGMSVSTGGLPGPVMANRFGKPAADFCPVCASDSVDFAPRPERGPEQCALS